MPGQLEFDLRSCFADEMRHFCSPLVALTLIAFAGCARSPDALVAQQIHILDETADALATITDEPSAESAAPRLASLRRQIDELIPRVKALQLTAEQREEIEDQHRDDMTAALEKFEKQLARVLKLGLKVGGLSELEQALSK